MSVNVNVNVFGLTSAILRADYLPNADDFSTNSSPTDASVTRILNQKAGELQGRLLKEAIAATGITDAASAEYLWCQETLALMTMVRVVGLMTGADPELAKKWQGELDDRFSRLEKNGATELGNNSLASSLSSPTGPTTHVQELSLDTSDLYSENVSVVSFPLRKDDVL